MRYTKQHNLSKDAQRAFAPIFKTLTEKAIREKRIPDKITVWIDTNDQKLTDELEKAGLIAYAFTENGQDIYTHTVDQQGLKEALGWTRN